MERFREEMAAGSILDATHNRICPTPACQQYERPGSDEHCPGTDLCFAREIFIIWNMYTLHV